MKSASEMSKLIRAKKKLTPPADTQDVYAHEQDEHAEDVISPEHDEAGIEKSASEHKEVDEAMLKRKARIASMMAKR